MPTMTAKVYTPAELAELLGISRQAVYKGLGSKYRPDVKDASGEVRYFSEELAARLLSERESKKD